MYVCGPSSLVYSKEEARARQDMTFSTYSGTPSENGRRRRKKLSGQKALINGFLDKSRVEITRDFSKICPNPVNKRFLPVQRFSSFPPVFGGRPRISGKRHTRTR
jgi:hypothetical protein